MTETTGPEADSGADAAPRDVTYGLLSLAGIEVALPISALREVVPCPAAFADLPASADGLLGAMSVRDLVVPVVDLRPRLGAAAGRTNDQVVVIIAQDDRLLGVLADAARGIAKVATGDVRAVEADGGPLLFSHSFRHPVLGSVVSVLDVATVLRLPGVPTVQDVPPAVAEEHAVTGLGGRRRTFTLLGCDGLVIGIEVSHVHTTLGDARVQPSVLDSALCRGVTEYRDVEVPVVDPLELLGLGRVQVDGTGVAVVLKPDEGYVALSLTAVVDIIEMTDDQILPLPAFSVRRPELLSGIADIEGVGQALILDGNALLADDDLQALAAMNTPVAAVLEAKSADPGTSADGAAAAVAGRDYLSYSIGPDVVSPLEQISEIVPLPETRTQTGVGDVVLGVTVHRSAAVPVLCLPTLLGLPRPSVTSATCLLLVQVDGDLVGFAVEGLRSIDPLVWEQRKTDGSVESDPGLDLTRVLREASLVTVGENGGLLPDLDLRAIARAFRAEMSAPAAGDEESPVDADDRELVGDSA